MRYPVSLTKYERTALSLTVKSVANRHEWAVCIVDLLAFFIYRIVI